MQERWIEFNGQFINLSQTTSISLSDDSWDINFFFADATPLSVNYDSKADGDEIIRAIIRGDYDVIRHPAYAQASASVEDVKKAIENDDLPF